MMESRMTRNCHVRFGERYEETHQSQDWKVRFVPTLLSPLLANIALNGIEDIHSSIRYADDMIVRPERRTVEWETLKTPQASVQQPVSVHSRHSE